MICTTIEQGKRLLELGLDPETADMVYPAWTLNDTPTKDVCEIRRHDFENENDVPAWSLSALLELMPYTIELCKESPTYVLGIYRTSEEYVIDYWNSNNGNRISIYKESNLLDAAVDMVEWLCKNGYLGKEGEK